VGISLAFIYNCPDPFPWIPLNLYILQHLFCHPGSAGQPVELQPACGVWIARIEQMSSGQGGRSPSDNVRGRRWVGSHGHSSNFGCVRCAGRTSGFHHRDDMASRYLESTENIGSTRPLPASWVIAIN